MQIEKLKHMNTRMGWLVLALFLVLGSACTKEDVPAAVCGDGTVAGSEICDDGNTATETCAYGETSCTVCNASCEQASGATQYCGDGAVDGPEGCDDGNTATEVCDYGETSCTVCDANCQEAAGAASYCGDGVVDTDAGEICDDGNDNPNDGCSTDCAPAACGNGILEGGETCDDGNTVTETCAYGETECEVCNAECEEVPGATEYCGDGATQAGEGELCDDGNQDDTDTCLNTCVNAACGDGVIQAGVETCDDGNTETDSCPYGDESCTVCGESCTEVPGITTWCGDNVVDEANGETCDDGNTYTERCDYGITDCPVCSYACQEVQGFISYCGDDDLDWNDGESCDDGNTDDGDYCSADCSDITGTCGDLLVQDHEVCDDGNTEDNDHCSADCMLITGACGDGVVQGNEVCDDSNTDEGDYCSADCTELTGFCSDGVVQTNEACDDANLVDGDYCSSTCLVVTGSCGDGAVQVNEACDDTNLLEGDYCAAACTSITGRCGDGVVQTNEVCDDGNYDGNDLCSADCSVEVDNVAPTIDAMTDQSLVANGCLAMVVKASDIGDDPLTFSLESAPDGMTIDATTGVLTWYPEPTQVGSHTAVVRVFDGGLAATAELTVEVLEGNTDDKVAPVVAINGARQVLAGENIFMNVVASDASGVVDVSLKLGELNLGSHDAPPYQFAVNAPVDADVVTTFEVLVTDAAGNTTALPWDVVTVAALETDAPVIESIRTPPAVLAGTSFKTAAVVSDATGVASVAVYQDGTMLSEASMPPFELSIAVPEGTSHGNWNLTLRVEDFTGQITEQPWTVQVAGVAQESGDSTLSLQGPSRVTRTQAVQASATAAGNDVASVALWLDGVEIAKGYTSQVSTQVVVGEARIVGETVRMRAVATSFDGVARDAYACLQVVESLDGFVYGSVLHDESGHPVAGASVKLRDSLGGEWTATTDEAGRYQVGTHAGAYRVEIDAPGTIGAWRNVVAVADGFNRVLDARLAAVQHPQPVPAIGELSISAGAWRWDIPSGAMLGNANTSLSVLSPQSIPARVPAGYAPVAAVALGDVASLSTLTTKLTLVNGGGPTSGSERFIAAHYDVERDRWVRMAMNSVDASLELSLQQTGVIAILRPDRAPVVPVDVEVGETLVANSDLVLGTMASGDLLPAQSDIVVTTLSSQPVAEVLATVVSENGIQSGTAIQVDVTESYHFLDGSLREPTPAVRDLLVYQNDTDGAAEATIYVSPTEPLFAETFAQGTINLRSRGETEPSVYTRVDGQAGSLTVAGHKIDYPNGSFALPGALQVRYLDLPEQPLSDAGLWDVLAGFELSGAELLGPVTLVMNTPGEAVDAQLALLRRVSDGDRTGFALVDMGQLVGAATTFAASFQEAAAMPGMDRLGDYRVVRLSSPWQLVTGVVDFGTPNEDAAWVEASASLWPFVGSAQTASPQYALLTDPSDPKVAARSLSRGFRAEAELSALGAGTSQVHNLALQPAPPTVVSSTPADGAQDVGLTGSVAITFSQRMAEAAASANAIWLEGPNGLIATEIQLLGDGRTVVLTPDMALIDLTPYEVRGSDTVVDHFGQAMDVGGQSNVVLLTFETGDFTPPPLPAPGSISVSVPSGGISTAIGGAGTVEPGTLVVFRNQTTGETVTVQANADGSFAVTGNAEVGDAIDLLFVDASGNETTFTPEVLESADGTILLGEDGGQVSGPGGLVLAVPSDAIEDNTVMRLETLGAEDLDVTLPSWLSWVHGVRIVLEGDAERAYEEMDLSGPLPEGATFEEGEQLLVYREKYFAGSTYLHLVEEALVFGDTFETQSPPFQGILEAGEYVIAAKESVKVATGSIPAEPGLSGYVLIHSEDVTTYAEWEAGEVFVFAVADGASYYFEVFDDYGLQLYSTEPSIADWNEEEGHTEVLDAVYRGAYFGFNLMGSSPLHEAVDVDVLAPVYLRFSDALSNEMAVTLCVRRADNTETYDGCEPTNISIEQDLQDQPTIVSIRHLGETGFEPQTPYTVDIIQIGSAHDLRLELLPEVINWSTGVAPSEDVDDYETNGYEYDAMQAEELFEDLLSEDTINEFTGPFNLAQATPTAFAGLMEQAEDFVHGYDDAVADVVDIDQTLSMTFSHPLDAFNNEQSICVKAQPRTVAAEGGNDQEQSEAEEETCIQGSFDLVQDGMGAFNTLEFVPDWRFEYGRTYEVILENVRSIAGQTISELTPSIVFHVFRPELRNWLRLDAPIWELERSGGHLLLVGLGHRADMNGNYADDEAGIAVVDITQPESAYIEDHRVMGGLQTSIHVRKDGSFLSTSASWYHPSYLKAYSLNGLGDLEGPLWNQKLTMDTGVWEAGGVVYDYDGVLDEGDFAWPSMPGVITEQPTVSLDHGFADNPGNIVRTYRDSNGLTCSDVVDEDSCRSRFDCRWELSGCELSRERLNQGDHWTEFIGASWAVTTMDQNIADTTCSSIDEEDPCNAELDCAWDETNLTCYFAEGADEHMYVATIGVGVQHVTRTVKEVPGEILEAHQVDFFQCPGCMTVATFEGSVLAGDGQQLYVLNPDLTLKETWPIPAKRIYVAKDFAVQQHGTFDMAFVVQPGGEVTLLTLKAPELQDDQDAYVASGAAPRFMRMGSFWLPPPTNQPPGAGDPTVNIRDMAFDAKRFLAYAATSDGLFTVDLSDLVSDYCAQTDYESVYPVVGHTPVFDTATYAQTEYTRITLSRDGRYLFVGDGADLGDGRELDEQSALLTIAVSSDAGDIPELHESLYYEPTGQIGTCKRLVFTRKYMAEIQDYLDDYQVELNSNRQSLLSLANLQVEVAYELMIEPIGAGVITGKQEPINLANANALLSIAAAAGQTALSAVLGGVSFLLDVLPITGNLKGLIEYETGFNFITGEPLSEEAQMLAGAAVILPFVGKFLFKVGGKVIQVGRQIKAGATPRELFDMGIRGGIASYQAVARVASNVKGKIGKQAARLNESRRYFEDIIAQRFGWGYRPWQPGQKLAWQLAKQMEFRTAARFIPPPAAERGILPFFEESYLRMAIARNENKILRDSSQDAVPHIEDAFQRLKDGLLPRALPKTEKVKAKTWKKGDSLLINPANAGLAGAHPNHPRTIAMLENFNPPLTYIQYLKKMADDEMTVDIPVNGGLLDDNVLTEYWSYLAEKGLPFRTGDDFIVRNADNQGYFSDLDWHGHYDATTGKTVWPEFASQAEKSAIRAHNRRLKVNDDDVVIDMTQHGSQDDWPDKLLPGPNRGPQIFGEGDSVTVLHVWTEDGVRKGRAINIDNVDDMRDFYVANNISWADIWQGEY